MFEPLFKIAEPPPPPGWSSAAWDKHLQKGPKVTKTAAPLDLIRKLAAEGVPKEQREKQIKREHSQLGRKLLVAKGPGTLAGGLGGAALGAYAGHRSGLGKLVGGYGGLVGGAALGGMLGGGSKGRELEGKMDSLEQEQKSLAAMQPGTTGPLTNENLDREGYHQARADAAQAELDLGQSTKPLRRGSMAGFVAGGALGAGLGPRLLGARGTPLARALLGSTGAMYGSMLGMGTGAVAMGQSGRRDVLKALKSGEKAEGQRDQMWEGASTLDEPAPLAAIRKAASALAFDELTTPIEQRTVSTETLIWREKFSAVADLELLKIARQVSTTLLPDNSYYTPLHVEEVLATYESLGGKYKHAFGAPMFDMKQMAGSPALAGGMTRRSSTPMPSAQKAQPVQSPATASPRAQVQGGASAPSTAPSQTAAPSAAPAPASAAAPSVSVSMG